MFAKVFLVVYFNAVLHPSEAHLTLFRVSSPPSLFKFSFVVPRIDPRASG